MKKLMLALAVVSSSLAQAVTYQAETVKDDVNGQFSCITNASSWNPEGLPEEGKNYSVQHTVYLPTKLTSYEDYGATFPGTYYQTATKHTVVQSYTYFKGGIHQCAGSAYLRFGGGVTHMKGDLYRDNRTSYVQFGSADLKVAQHVYWDGVDLKGAERLCMVADGATADGAPLATLHWRGDVSGFTTTILMARSNGKVPFRVEFPEAVTFNTGDMTIQDGIVLRTQDASKVNAFKGLTVKTSKYVYGNHYSGLDPVNGSVCEIATGSITGATDYPAVFKIPTNGTVRVGTLTIGSGTTFVGCYDGTAASAQHPLEVMTKLTLPSGKIKVRVDYANGVAGGPGAEGVAILRVPESVQRISPDQFEIVQGLVDDIASGYCLPTVTNMAVTVEGGVQTLRLYPQDIVRLLQNQTDMANPADRVAAVWSDGKVPHAGVDYFANGRQMRLSGSTFAGASLSVNQTMQTANIHVDDLRLGAVQIQCYGGLKWTGHARLLPHTSNWASVLVYSADYNDHFYLSAELSDAGNLWLMYRGAKTDALLGGTVYFTGINTNWTGKLRIACQNGAENYKFDDGKYNETVVIEDERNLGGRLGAFAYDALTIRDMNVLAVTNDVTVGDDYNRGILVDYFARVKVPEGKTLALNRPVTYNGLLRKEDAGTLALGAAARFKDGKEDTPPAANSNLLHVAAGYVKPTAKGALDGLAITFAEGAGLELDAGTEYGLYDQKAGGSVTGADIPVRINLGAWAAGRREFGVGVVTADTKDAAEALFAKFALRRPRGYTLTTATVENADGTWTVKATCVPSGMTLIFK